MADTKLMEDPRNQKLIAGAVLMVMAVGLYWYLKWNPDHKEVVLIAAHADTLETKNEAAAKLVARGNERQIRAESDRYSAELAALRRLVPTENEVPGLIDAISTVARRTGMEVSQYAPDGTLPGDYFDAVRFRFAITGPYHKVAEFFTEVASLDRIITPINVQILGLATSAGGGRKPGRDEVFVNVNFGVLTYVAKTIAPPPPAAPPRGGGN